MKKLLVIILTLFSLHSFAQDTIYVRPRGIPGAYNFSKSGDSLIFYVAGVRHALSVGSTVDLSNYYNKGQIDDSLATKLSASYEQSITAIKPLHWNIITPDSATIGLYVDTTSSLSDGSDTTVPSTKAVRNYIDANTGTVNNVDSLGGQPASYYLSNAVANATYATIPNLNLKANDNAVMHTTGNESFGGIKNFTGSIGINNSSPLAPLHVGNANVNNSVDAELLVSRNVDNTGTGNAHGYSDGSQITRGGGMAYASYDARVNILGTNSYNHYVSFQASPSYGSSGTITNLYGIYSLPTISAGTVTNNYGAFIERANVVGGTIQNDYGLFIDAPIAGTVKNYAIYSNGTAPSYLGGNLSIGKTFNNYGGYGNVLDLNGGITLHRASDGLNTYILAAFDSANNIKTTISLDPSNNVIFNNKTTGKYLAFYTDNTNLALVLSGGKAGIGKIPTVPLDVVGNIASTGTITASSLIKSGGTSSQFLKADGSTSILILTGTAAPTVTPDFIGQNFIDTTNKKAYKAMGTSSSADWVILN